MDVVSTFTSFNLTCMLQLWSWISKPPVYIILWYNDLPNMVVGLTLSRSPSGEVIVVPNIIMIHAGILLCGVFSIW